MLIRVLKASFTSKFICNQVFVYQILSYHNKQEAYTCAFTTECLRLFASVFLVFTMHFIFIYRTIIGAQRYIELYLTTLISL